MRNPIVSLGIVYGCLGKYEVVLDERLEEVEVREDVEY